MALPGESARPLVPSHEPIHAREFALFAVILTAAIVARVWNISWGLPDVFEEATPFVVARKFWGEPGGSFSFRPDFYHYPALGFYLHFVVQALQFLAGAVGGQFGSLDAFRTALETSPGGFMTGGRLLSALFDAGTVGLVWLTAREMFGRWIGVGAALLAAFNPLMLASAQSVNVDVILTFFLVATLWRSLKLSGHAGAREFLLTGLAVGLAASTKYTGALFLALPVTVVAADLAFGAGRTVKFIAREVGLLLLIPLSAAVVFAVLNPYIFADVQGFLRDFTYEQHHMEYGHLGLDTSRGSAEYYLAGVLVPKLGLLLLGGAAAGIVASFAARNPAGVAVAVTAVSYVAVLSSWEMRAERYILPAVPLVAILCSAGCIRAMTWAAARTVRGTGPTARDPRLPFLPRLSMLALLTGALAAAAVLAALFVPAQESISHLTEQGKTDTRTRARQWIEANVPPGSVITTGPFGITFGRERGIVYIPFVATGAEATAPFYIAGWYEDLDLLVASDYDAARYAREPERFAGMMKFYRDLEESWRPLAAFTPDSALRGPSIWLYAPDPSRATERFDEAMLRGLASVNDRGIVLGFVRNLASALVRRGKAQKCEQLLDFGLGLSPEDSELAATKAYLLYKEARYTEALDFVSRAERSGGRTFELLSLRGSLLLETGDLDAAEEALIGARDLRPGARAPYTLLIRLYSERSDRRDLIGTLERYLQLIPPEGEESEKVRVWLDSLRRAG